MRHGKTKNNNQHILYLTHICLLCNRHYLRGFVCTNILSYEMECIFFPVFQMRKLMHRKILDILPKVTQQVSGRMRIHICAV